MVDPQQQVAAVDRALRNDEVDGEPSFVQTLTQEYAAPLEDVWDSTTSSERIARWFLPITGDLHLGGRYQLEGNAGGEVLSCTPPSDGAAEFRVTWEYAGGITWLNVRLTALDDERTRLELEHVAHTAEVPEGMWEQFGPGATGLGWDGGLFGLARHLEDPSSSMTPEAGLAWAVSEEGKAFHRAAADGWCAAHVAAGADPDEASAAANRTYAAYTGQEPA